MASYPRPRINRPPSPQVRVRSLLRLNEAVQKINSILELDLLLDRIVNDIAYAFGLLEAAILLKEPGTNEVIVAAVMGCSQCKKHERFVIGIDGLVGYVANTGMTLYTPDVTKEPRYIACEPNTLSELDIPLIVNDEVIGVFSAQHPEVDGFPLEQRALLEALGRHIAVAIENARIFEREKQKTAQLRAREDEARRIQQALFPQKSPQVPGFHIQGRCLPAEAVGGDYYDFVSIPQANGKSLCGLVIADVSGKGMAAALLMSATRAIVRSITQQTPRPAEVLQRVNRVLLDDLPPEKFVTMAFAVLDAEDKKLTLANAGHPWPILVNKGKPSLLQTGLGLPLGIADCDYDELVIELGNDTRVLFYSDGVSEAPDANGNEFGVERLMEASAKPDASTNSVLDEVCDFSPSCPLADDATLLLLKAQS